MELIEPGDPQGRKRASDEINLAKGRGHAKREQARLMCIAVCIQYAYRHRAEQPRIARLEIARQCFPWLIEKFGIEKIRQDIGTSNWLKWIKGEGLSPQRRAVQRGGRVLVDIIDAAASLREITQLEVEHYCAWGKSGATDFEAEAGGKREGWMLFGAISGFQFPVAKGGVSLLDDYRKELRCYELKFGEENFELHSVYRVIGPGNASLLEHTLHTTMLERDRHLAILERPKTDSECYRISPELLVAAMKDIATELNIVLAREALS